MGCPALSLTEACDVAARFKTWNLELRSLNSRLDLDRMFAEEQWTPARAAKLFEQTGARFVVAGSSFKLVGNTPATRAEFLRFADWAESWSAPYVRVFGGGTWGTPLTAADYKEAAAAVAWWRTEKARRNWNIKIIMETHDAFCASEPCLNLFNELSRPMDLLWDSHHTWRLGGESPADTWKQLSPWLWHVHLKDSIDVPSARHPFTYVLPGDGQMPLDELISVLCANEFTGTVSLEWEKLWHPYLPPIDQALTRLEERNWFMPSHELLSQTV